MGGREPLPISNWKEVQQLCVFVPVFLCRCVSLRPWSSCHSFSEGGGRGSRHLPKKQKQKSIPSWFKHLFRTEKL